ncbi:MAG TPA: glycosyltransferase [Candidatus Acidoferrales bacterium]|nr:glycosyltransferase [Candidatus Acidoferrales bacterium]
MVILYVHNYYREAGGEDAGVRQERDLLAGAGHRIVEYSRSSDEIVLNGLPSRMRLGTQAVWSRRTGRDIRSLLARERPDVAHFHNIVPLVSPSAYYACAEAGVPVVQTLHNYRLLCPAGTLLREGRICEECVEHSLFRSVRYRCYHESAAQTGTIALMLASHRAMGTWARKVDCYIARTEFARQKFIEGGLPAEKVVVKPCFVQLDPGLRHGRGDNVLFVGRLSPEKGLRTLLKAWERLGGRMPLRIAGDGPLRPELEAEARQRDIRGVTFLGRLDGHGVLAEMKRARFLVFPSEWYEGLPLTIAEAFACGLPVIASRMGSMLEIVEDGRTGCHFTSGDAEALAVKVEWAWTHPKEIDSMSRDARTEYEAKYTPERNYQLLMRIHERVLAARDRAPS